MNKKSLFAALLAPLSISACSYSAIGVYSYGHAFWGEQLIVSDDGTFQYQTGSDDFSDNCKIFGKWAIDDDSPRLFVTRAEKIEVGEYTDDCDRQARITTWKMKQNAIIRLDASGGRLYAQKANRWFVTSPEEGPLLV
jgi:hypothetical protein